MSKRMPSKRMPSTCQKESQNVHFWGIVLLSRNAFFIISYSFVIILVCFYWSFIVKTNAVQCAFL